MAPRAKRRGRPRKRRVTQAGSGNGSARALLVQITELVDANEALSNENRRLQSALSQVSAAVSGVGSGVRAGARRGRPPAAASSRPVGRPRRRRRVTDPATLERRRAGLAKARAVLAAKRAAAKRKG
jgi:hypothetical protein